MNKINVLRDCIFMVQRTADADNLSPDAQAPFTLGPWRVDPRSGELTDGDRQVTLEPQLAALLCVLAREPGQVMPRDAIEAELWPDTIVGEDTLARAVSRLRRALGDSAQSPRYIETLPKRGYRLIEAVVPVRPEVAVARRPWVAVAALLVVAAICIAWFGARPDPDEDDPFERQVSRAQDLYMQFTRADNEAAIALYERVLEVEPEHPGAQAGLANALVQRVVRWPRTIGTNTAGASTLGDAIQSGLTAGPEAQAVLERATAMAEHAVRLAPRDVDALKALAFTHTARGDFDRGAELYEQLLALDSNYWAAWINLGEIHSIRGDVPGALAHFERGWAAMTRAYDDEPQRVGPWLAGMGVLIGDTHERLEQPEQAQQWYRRVLTQVPFEPEATARLARLLAAGGDAIEARSLCQSLTLRVGPTPGCSELVAP